VKTWTLESTQWVPAPLPDVFAFFSDAANLQAITPAHLDFRILTPLPVIMRPGAVIEYRLRLHGVPFRWRTVIDAWEPGVAFVDRQERGPYARWIHRHTFAAENGGTRLGDRVEYALPLDPFSRPAHPWFVRPAVEGIFAHRQTVIAARFGAGAAGGTRDQAPGAAAPRR
jgi:ligand-binding SRPBCC domain-containing protein